MRRALMVVMVMLLAAPAAVQAQAPENVAISDLSVKGRIEGENIVFTLEFVADVRKRKATIPIVVGDVALFGESKLPRKAKLTREGGRMLLTFPSRGKHSVELNFASRALKDREWRFTSFDIPVSNVRKLLVECDRDDLQVAFPGALNIERGKDEEEKMMVTAYLGLGNRFEVRWKPEVKRLDAEAVVECQANTITTASVGAMRLDTIFTYRVVQGSMEKVHLSIPEGLNITKVRGQDIRTWNLEKDDAGGRTLVVTLSRPKEQIYRLQVVGETVLSKFPCPVHLPVVNPQDVIRTSGFLMIGTDSAIKLVVKESVGLTQIDQASFPPDKLEIERNARQVPSRSMFAYQYANMPYSLDLDADDIVPEYSVDDRLVLSLTDNDLVFTASVQIDVRAAGTRELVIETDTGWTVANVSGNEVSDYDVRDENGVRLIQIYFRRAVLGKALLDVRLERTLKGDLGRFDVPRFVVRDAKSERGHIVLAAEKGLRLTTADKDVKGMREVHTGSIPMRVVGAQKAFRFKQSDWSVSASIDRTTPTIHTEIFHLVSIGEGVLYGSSTFTYHISGAPVRKFIVHVPEEYRNVEFSGRSVRNWAQDGDKWIVTLQEKAIGDYTLLVTYDRPFDYDGGTISVGGVYGEQLETEEGYIALASSAHLDVSQVARDEQIMSIEADEIPQAYKDMINDPVLRAYKYVKTPHVAKVKISRLNTERLLSQVVDHTTIRTTISEDGDVVTTVIYSAKNASRQYLTIKLPKGVARAWSTRVADENGVMVDVPSRQKTGADGLVEVLIPIPRPRNPNEASTVEVIYPESHKLGALGGALDLQAPLMTFAHATFVQWTVTVPETRTIASCSGNMEFVPNPSSGCGPSTATGPGLTLKALAHSLILPFYAPGASVIAMTRNTVNYGAEGYDSTMTFSQTMSLADRDPLHLNVKVAPHWVGPGGSFGRLIVVSLLGLVVTGFSFTKRSRNRWLAALGFTVLFFAFTQVAWGRVALVLTLRVAIIVLLIGFAFWMMFASRMRGRWVVGPYVGIMIAVLSLVYITAGWWLACMAALAVLALLLLVWPLIVAGFAVRRAEIKRQSVRQRTPPPPPTPPADEPKDDSDDLDGLERVMDLEDSPFEPVPGEEEEKNMNGESGFTTTRALVAILALMLGAGAALAQKNAGVPEIVPVYAGVVMDNVTVRIIGPGTGRDDEKSASIEKTLEFTVTKPISFVVVGPGGVLTGYDVNSRYAEISAGPGGYTLKINKKGSYKIHLSYLVPVSEANGHWDLRLDMPENMRNSVMIELPEPGMDIYCNEAVHFEKTESDSATTARAVFGSMRSVNFSWRPRVRKTQLEKTVFFCEANTFASFEPGVVDLTHLIRFQIAQGELKRMTVNVPENMSITAVHAAGLSTWRFDPEKHLLEAILESPVTGDFYLTVIAQVALGSAHKGAYDAAVAGVEVAGAAGQRGSMAVAVPDTMQARVESKEGLHAMNVADFSEQAVGVALSYHKQKRTIKRAFRYDDLPVRLEVRAEPVLPEIRVYQKRANLDIADEHIVLTTQLSIEISRAGVFSLELSIPSDFDVESLTGEDISHWDEIGENNDSIVVHFKNQVIGTRVINLVIARMEKGIEDTIEVPRVTVRNARKHTGVLVVSGERGVRLTSLDREGVSELSPLTDLNIRQEGVLAFKLLRPEWSILLATEVISPTIRPEVLQRIDLAEGMIRGHARIRYSIENAGCKSFYLQSPSPGLQLSVSGKDVVDAKEIDTTNGIWRVDLHNKVQDHYALDVSYQLPFTSQKAVINPVRTLDTDPQTGYLAVMSGGRVQVMPTGSLKGLKAADARSIPAAFRAGDMSDAIYCYQTVQPDYALELSVIRHQSAEVLPATVLEVSMISAVADDTGDMMTQTTMKLAAGDMRFLKLWLPDGSARLWTVFVNGQATEPARDGDAYRIPLEKEASDETTVLEFVYAQTVSKSFTGTQRYVGPRFSLPLNNITWTFYVVPTKKYYAFGGSMNLAEDVEVVAFDWDRYTQNNLRQMHAAATKAKWGLRKGHEYEETGDPNRAKKAYAEAMNLAQTQADREDARIQYENVAKQQAIVGLVQRRNKMRMQQNISGALQEEQLAGYNEGNFTIDYARSIQQSLDSDENAALGQLTQRIIAQQAAAAGVAQAIRIQMPEDGKKLEFVREIHINPESALTVEFKAVDLTGLGRSWNVLWIGLVALIVFRLTAAKLVAVKKGK